jgi:CBS domain-containing protein
LKEDAMKARELMTAAPTTCSPQTNLAAAAELMLSADCGLLPVLDEGKLVGVVTDRDLYIALATRNQRPADLCVGDVAQRPVYTCSPDDDLDTVLATMRRHRIRRVPVEGFGGSVLAVISIDDLAMVAGPAERVADRAVIDTLQAVRGEHHLARQIAPI